MNNIRSIFAYQLIETDMKTIATSLKLTSQFWTLENYTVNYFYETGIWWVNHASLEGLSFGKPSIKAARQALGYAIANGLL